jgi:hypothetical protein
MTAFQIGDISVAATELGWTVYVNGFVIGWVRRGEDTETVPAGMFLAVSRHDLMWEPQTTGDYFPWLGAAVERLTSMRPVNVLQEIRDGVFEWGNDHDPSCPVATTREELWANAVENDADDGALRGIVLEYMNGGDQEADECRCDTLELSRENAEEIEYLGEALATVGGVVVDPDDESWRDEPAEERDWSPEAIRADPVAWLVELYGDSPELVGSKDGTEDDYGDLLTDALLALGGVFEDLTEEQWQAFEDAAHDSTAKTMAGWVEDLRRCLHPDREVYHAKGFDAGYAAAVHDMLQQGSTANHRLVELWRELGATKDGDDRAWAFVTALTTEEER